MSELNEYQRRYNTVSLRLEAVSDFVTGLIGMHAAALDDGSPEEIRTAHNDAVEAFEDMLHIKEERARIWLSSHGIDPRRRHLS